VRPLRYFVWLILLAFPFGLVGGVYAQGVSSQNTLALRAWSSLTPAQQTALQPLQDSWTSIDGVHKRKWVEIAERFPSLTAADQARIQGRMAHWAQLTPSERWQTRLNYLQAQQIQASQRSTQWEAYQALTPEQREQLAAKASAAGASGAGFSRPSSATSSGATTSLVDSRLSGARANDTGKLKIETHANLVDSKTLLPKLKEDPSGAAAASAPSASRAQQ
jgi:Protein of unknown function (DUF3106)